VNVWNTRCSGRRHLCRTVRRYAAKPFRFSTPEASSHDPHEIARASHAQRLSGIAATLNTRITRAQSSQQPFLETFGATL
jgi:hypothetical protein